MSGDPSWYWDARQDDLMRDYISRIKGASCFDCANCNHPNHPYRGSIGWCLANDDFVYKGDGPEVTECGCYE